MRRLRHCLIAAGLVALCAFVGQAALAQGADAATPEKIDSELETRARDTFERYKANATRYIYYDIVWPKDEAEYGAVGKHAVLLVVAVSQDAAELPLRRVIADGRKSMQLRAVASRERPLAAGSTARRVLGPHRHETVFIVPVDVLLQERALVADFAINRTGFQIAAGPFAAPDFVKNDTKRAQAGKIDNAALADMVAREFPGFTLKR